jgi:hypothetical protein
MLPVRTWDTLVVLRSWGMVRVKSLMLRSNPPLASELLK